MERQTLDVDIVCVGFGPAAAGFLTTLSRGLVNPDGSPRFESKACPGLPLQVICYERADGLAFGVSGAVTRARGIRSSFPELDPSQIPLASPVTDEKLVYLLDPWGASRRPAYLRALDALLRFAGRARFEAFEVPFIPEFLHKGDGLVLSIGQFLQWVGDQILATGAVQIWPSSPVAHPLVENGGVVGIRLVDQGTDLEGNPTPNFLPGMDVRALLTVVADGPYGPVGRALDERFGLPSGHEKNDWALGMKFVIQLPDSCSLQPGTVIHTLGFPEPEIFGFCYVHPSGLASVGIFVPSWFHNPARSAYRYLQHFIQHPYLWRHFKGGTLRSWGAKSVGEWGLLGEPFLALDGCARIGEGAGSTNVLTGSGIDEAWTTGVVLAEGVLELLQRELPFTRAHLERAYVARLRQSWVGKEAKPSSRARVGFHRGFLVGMLGMALSGFTRGRLWLPIKPQSPQKHLRSAAEFYKSKINPARLEEILSRATVANATLHDALMDAAGWPPIQFDGKLLVSQQDALLVGGKVQAPPGYANHVVFVDPAICDACKLKVCVEICSGQAIALGENGRPTFDREKCVHCGACLWNCAMSLPHDPAKTNVEFHAGAGGLHSPEN